MDEKVIDVDISSNGWFLSDITKTNVIISDGS